MFFCSKQPNGENHKVHVTSSTHCFNNEKKRMSATNVALHATWSFSKSSKAVSYRHLVDIQMYRDGLHRKALEVISIPQYRIVSIT